MWLPRVSLVLTALAFGGFGALLLLRPETLAVVGVDLTTPSARTEIRGFYGGLELGFALFFAMAAARPVWFVPGLVAQSFSLGGVALGRVFGLVVDGSPESLTYALLAAESAGCLIGVAALARLRSIRADRTLPSS
jgi:hypothetical protein